MKFSFEFPIDKFLNGLDDFSGHILLIIFPAWSFNFENGIAIGAKDFHIKNTLDFVKQCLSNQKCQYILNINQGYTNLNVSLYQFFTLATRHTRDVDTYIWTRLVQ